CGDIGRSQSLHSTEAGRREDTATQPYPRAGRQEGGCVVSGVNESHRQGEEPPVSITTNRGSLSPSEWTVIGRSNWTGCMLTARVTASKGQSPLLLSGGSHIAQPASRPVNPDVETTDWRAVCGRTARTVRRAGTAGAVSDPYHGAIPHGHSTGPFHRAIPQGHALRWVLSRYPFVVSCSSMSMPVIRASTWSTLVSCGRMLSAAMLPRRMTIMRSTT